jgi:hypothetical protein
VDAIFDLVLIIIKLAVVGGGLLLVMHMLKSKKFNGVKNDIQNLQAKVSQLRLALKGKVKRKANVFRSQFKGPLVEGDILDSSLRELGDNSFENGQHFQDYFDLSRKLVNHLLAESAGDAAPQFSVENNFMSSDFKTEMDIIRIIKEMCDLSAKINNKIDEHNRINPGQKLARVESLVFPSMSEVTRMFESNELSTKTSAEPVVKVS